MLSQGWRNHLRQLGLCKGVIGTAECALILLKW